MALNRIESEWNGCSQRRIVFTYIEHAARRAGIDLPSDVIRLCVKMIGLNSFVWHIDDIKGPFLKQILSATPGDQFQSEVFEVGKLNWQIELDPNGSSRLSMSRYIKKCVSLV
eukprot:1093232_1